MEKNNNQLPVMEQFYSIQGEGYHVGVASDFIRLGGCDVGCHWCDVKESWNSSLHPQTSVKQIVSNLGDCKTVIITGGEPLMWNLDYLCQELKSLNKNIHLETSGSHKYSGEWDWICLSPKKNINPLDEIYLKASELKIIIYNLNDFKFAEEQASKVNDDCVLYLQPEWSKREKMTPQIVDYVKKNNQWKISLQVHKTMHIP